MPSLGALMGTSAGTEVLQAINARYGSTYFGERYEASRSAFMTNVVQPIYNTMAQLETVANRMVGTEKIVALRTREEFHHVPAALHIPILSHPRMRELLASGRIDGWGYIPEDLPTYHASDEHGGNPYQRLLDNGRVDGVGSQIDPKTGVFTVRYRMNGHDPQMDADEKENLRITYRIMEEILDETNLDPTSFSNMRG